MKSGTQDQEEGTFRKIKRISQRGRRTASDNPSLEAEGTVEKGAGKVQKKIGQVKKVFGK
jgi:uncharacterized protein YjbJ (UPF0337 family)